MDLSGDDYDVIAVRYGTRMTRKSEACLGYASYGEPDEALAMDYFFWVIRNQDNVIVVDTGFSAEAAIRRGRTSLIEPGVALRRLGIDPREVRLLILTHVHWDHTGNLGLFPSARIVMSRTEYEFISGPLVSRRLLEDVMEPQDNLNLLRLASDGRVDLVGTSETLLPGIELREFGGHSPGQLCVFVKGQNRTVILSSDAVHYYEELMKGRPFVVTTNLLDMYRSLEMLRHLSSQPGTVLVAGHDPDVMRRFRPVDPRDPQFAVVV